MKREVIISEGDVSVQSRGAGKPHKNRSFQSTVTHKQNLFFICPFFLSFPFLVALKLKFFFLVALKLKKKKKFCSLIYVHQKRSIHIKRELIDQ